MGALPYFKVCLLFTRTHADAKFKNSSGEAATLTCPEEKGLSRRCAAWKGEVCKVQAGEQERPREWVGFSGLQLVMSGKLNYAEDEQNSLRFYSNPHLLTNLRK